MSDTANLDSRLELLLRLVGGITTSPDLHEVLGRVVRSAVNLVEGSLSTIWTAEGSRLVARARAGLRRRSSVSTRTEIAIGEGIIGTAALERRTLLVPDVLADPRTVDREYFIAEGLNAYAAVPLVSHDRLVGVLALVTARAADLGVTEVEMLTAFGGHAAIAIESARLYADADRRRREAETLADIARDLAEHHDLDAILGRIARGAHLLCGGDVTGLAVRDADDSFPARHVIGAHSDAYQNFRVIPGLGIGGRVAVDGRPVRVSERTQWPWMPPEYAGPIDAEGIRSALVVPIVLDQRIDGLLYVCNRSPRSFSDADETLLVRLANHAAAAIRTGRLFAAEQAARSEAQAAATNYRDLVDTLDAIVLDADAETFQVTYVNRRAEAILGYPVEAWYADPRFWVHHVHPDDREGAAAACLEATADCRDHVLQYRMLAADGRVVWMHDMVRVMAAGPHGRRQLRSVMVDITERTRAEALLAGEREILGMIAAGAPTAGVLDAVCRLIESMSAGLLASIVLVENGRLRHGAAPSLPLSFMQSIDGAPIGPNVGSCGTAAYRKETVVVTDIATDPLWADFCHLALPHGLRACWSSPVVDGRGEVIATFALYRRVPGVPSLQETELVGRATHLIRIVSERDRATVALQRSEEHYRTLVTHVPAVTWVADAGGGTIFVSPNTFQVTGFAADELRAGGMDAWLARIHPDDVASVRQRYEALQFEQEPYDIDYRLRHRNGHWIWIHDCAMSVYERDGVPYFAGVLVDVTARKQAELEVQQQRQLLTHLTRVATLGELSGALAHELNQPLTSILSNAQAALQFLAREPADLAEVRDILQDIVDEDRRAGEVIRRLRSLLRKGETARQPLDVNEVTNDVLRLLHSELIASGVAVTLQLAPGLPTVEGDRVALQQVLLNLIVNACDAMRLDELPERRMAVTTALDGDGAVLVAIADRGAGLPLDGAERVFEPFFTTKEHGLGLGLVICRSIVAAHGGHLSATNNADRGATFWFTLPARNGANRRGS
jgi:PAS domain S-box-containing protein